MIQPRLTLIDESVATSRNTEYLRAAGMLLTLVRHACASRQNKFAVHVLQQDRSLACHVREDSLGALGEEEGKEVDDTEKSSKPACCRHVSTYL